MQYKSVLKDKYSRGFWQSEKYFQPISKEIKTELKVKTQPSASNQKIIDAMQVQNAVCVHIRRGDYVGLVQLVCTPAYYYKAMDVIASKIENPQFYIFSDSISWVKENMNFSHPVHFVEQDNEDYEELRLMYTCKHFIISNSSFSWWAQYLSENEQKVVVAPSRWFNNNWKTPDVYMDFWDIVEV